ncbi:MAG: restriction endonuclease subunit S, partial [Methylococcales bacterium]
MSEPTKKALVPVLRFPEFRDTKEWINSTLGDISTITSGGTPSRTKNQYWDGNIPWVTTSLIDFNIIQSANEFI